MRESALTVGEIYERTRKVLAKDLHMEEEKITLETRLDQLIYDMGEILEIFLFLLPIEELFSICFERNEVDKLVEDENVELKDVVEMVKVKLA